MEVGVGALTGAAYGEQSGERLAQRNGYRDRAWETRAGTVDMRAQKMIGIRGENAVISARVLAKIDGEQIHVG